MYETRTLMTIMTITTIMTNKIPKCTKMYPKLTINDKRH